MKRLQYSESRIGGQLDLTWDYYDQLKQVYNTLIESDMVSYGYSSGGLRVWSPSRARIT